MNRKILIASFLMILAACSLNYDSETSIIYFPEDQINNEIRVFPFLESNIANVYDSLDISIEVISENPIRFDPDYSTEVYRYANDQWMLVDQVPTTYYGWGDFILHQANGDYSKMGHSSVIPFLPEDEVSTVRIYVYGNPVVDGEISDDVVGGYVNFYIKPLEKDH